MKETAAASAIVPGRSCGSCTMCCKIFDIPQINKLYGQWCPHVRQGRGCGIYETRPDVCRTYHCAWLLHPHLGPEWKPERAKFTLDFIDQDDLRVMVDPKTPHAWKQQPYYAQIKSWAAQRCAIGKFVRVYVGRHLIVVLPDHDEDIGVLGEGDVMSLMRRQGPEGVRYRVKIESSGDASSSGADD